jgi:glycosyltransferase involved in cell wall biosynthesis
LKIAYIAHLSSAAESGVVKKITAQIKSWRCAGHKAQLFAMTENRDAAWPELARTDPQLIQGVGLRQLIGRAQQQCRQICKWSPDVVYMRGVMYLPGWHSVARRLPMIMEINADDLAEARKKWPRALFWWHRRSRNWMLDRAAGLVFVTNELSERFAGPQPRVVISNGIDLDNFKTLPVPNNKSPKLVFVGSARHDWNGFDHLGDWAAQRPNWSFDIVGASACELPPFPSNVQLHGHLCQNKYRQIMAQSDIGIGTLASYRHNLNEGCALKVREYLAWGLPIIMGYRDTDFLPPTPPFVLELPCRPNNVADHLAEIDKFVDHWVGRRVAHDQIQHLDHTIKEQQRIEFFKRILNA